MWKQYFIERCDTKTGNVDYKRTNFAEGYDTDAFVSKLEAPSSCHRFYEPAGILVLDYLRSLRSAQNYVYRLVPVWEDGKPFDIKPII